MLNGATPLILQQVCGCNNAESQVSRRRDCAKRGEQEHVHVRQAGAAQPGHLTITFTFCDIISSKLQRISFPPLLAIMSHMPTRSSPLPNAVQGWITAAEESSAVRVSASDGFDLSACVAPKPLPPPLKPRPQSAAPAAELKNPYRGMIKEGKIAWVCAALQPSLVRPHAACRHSASQRFPPKTHAPRPRFFSGCTARAASVPQSSSPSAPQCHPSSSCQARVPGLNLGIFRV